MSDFEQFKEDFLDALERRKPKYLTGVDLQQHVPGSANKHLLENAALAISSPKDVVRVLDWAAWYVTRPLHENEETTPSESYRTAIAYPTLAIAGVAEGAGRSELADALLDRSRADISDLALSASTSPPRRVDDHGEVGSFVVLRGNGPQAPVPGSDGRLPYIAAVGKRGHVRASIGPPAAAALGSRFSGPFEYLYEHGLSVMLAQAVGFQYSTKVFDWQHRAHDAILRRWPGLRVWGFEREDADLLIDYLAAPADPVLALQVHRWAAAYPSNEERRRVRDRDGTILSVAGKLGKSSTGGLAVNVGWPDGRILRTSLDNGSRGELDVRPQTTTIDGASVIMRYDDGSASKSIDNPIRHRAWESVISTSRVVFWPQADDSGVTPGPYRPADEQRPSNPRRKRRRFLFS
jgi:hypothetical protein